MYYIVNHTNNIIAADNDLLELLSVKNIDELYKKIALGDILLTSPSNKEVIITTEQIKTSYQTQKHTLSGMLGELTLIEVHSSIETEVNIEKSEIDNNDISILDDEPLIFNDVSQDNIAEDTSDKDISFIKEESEEKPFELISDDESVTFNDTHEDIVLQTETSYDEQPFDLLKDEEETDIDEKDTLSEETKAVEAQTDTSPILIDIEKVSQKIGISTDDYNNFLNEYIDTALTLENDLKSTEAHKKSQAISTLSHLSNVLHLPVISNIIDEIQKSDSDTQLGHIKSLYNTLARLTTSKEESTNDVAELQVEETPEIELSEATVSEPESAKESFGSIDLSDVKPIHFDFQMEEAANDLSLPVELIEEFVQDFIVQAHEETDKMLKAYEEGDLDTIQKLGHLLKGTASNLRINPLADTLYEIQFCDDSSKLEDLIKEYWGHFLSFETQINLTSK